MASVVRQMNINTSDACPACGESLKDQLEKAKLLTKYEGHFFVSPIGNPFVITCAFCGVVYTPESLLPRLIDDCKPRRIIRAGANQLGGEHDKG